VCYGISAAAETARLKIVNLRYERERSLDNRRMYLSVIDELKFKELKSKV